MKAATILVVGGLVGMALAGPAAAQSAVVRGKYLLYAGGCISCHTDKATLKAKGPILGGGRALKTPFGTFYGPNITPHPIHGIGRWTAANFVRALRHGRSPSGHSYFPAFPYTSFTRITDRDARALFAYIRTLKPVAKPNRPHNVGFPFNLRFLAMAWKWLYFRRGAFRPDPSKSKRWNRGAYLVTALGHCTECHTPRGRFGGLRHKAGLSGASLGPDGSTPNITPDKATGIGDWSDSDLKMLLKFGILPDSDVVGAEMAEVVAHGTTHLSDADLDAIGVYLKSLPPVRSRKAAKK